MNNSIANPKKRMSGHHWLIMTCCVLLLTGCGTIQNIATNQPRYFGGVTTSAFMLTNSLEYEEKGFASYGIATLLYIDIPISFVSDTATLPVIMIQKALGEPLPPIKTPLYIPKE